MRDFIGKLHFGIGYKGQLPEGWKLTEYADDWTIGTDPEGRDYLLTDERAYPVVETHGRHGIDVGRYIDLKTGAMVQEVDS